MIIALAAAPTDFNLFEWMSNKGPDFDLKLSNSPAVLVETDDLIGLRKATRGPTTGSYQVVLAKYPQLIYRSVPESKIKGFLHNLKPYHGVPDKPDKTDKRRTAISAQFLEQGNKQTAQFYRTPGTPTETGGYSKDNYQWRKVVRPIKIVTKEHGKSRATLKEGDVVGVRYMRKSHGGHIIMPNGERTIIAHDVYEQVTLNTDILPKQDQLRGWVDLDDIKKNLPKGTRITIPRMPKMPKAPKGIKIPGGKHGTKTFVEQNKDLVTRFDYKDIDEEFEFEDEDDLLNPPDEFELETEEDIAAQKGGKTVNTPEAPELPEEFEEEEDDPEMDFQQDEEVDEEGEPVEDEEAVFAQEGLVLKTKDNVEWIVVGVENHGLSDTLLMYNPDKKSLRHYKVHTGVDLRDSRSVTVSRVISGSKLDKYLNEAAELESKSGTRL